MVKNSVFVWRRNVFKLNADVITVKQAFLLYVRRYDHYATLCELLPVAIPSLALCLKVWLTGAYSGELHMSVAKELGYMDTPLLLNPNPR